MGTAISHRHPKLALEMGQFIRLLPLPWEYPQSYLHNKCYRICPPSVQETDENQGAFPNENSL